MKIELEANIGRKTDILLDRDAGNRIVENWVDILLENGRKDQELLYFNILTLNMDKISEEYWEPFYVRLDLKIYASFSCKL